MRILLAEADRTLCDRLAHALRADRYSVDSVHSAREAERALHDPGISYQIVLLDSGLPETGGLEILRNLRRAGNTVPVLMSAGRNAIADCETGLDYGNYDFLIKPFELVELKARIRALSRQRSSQFEPALKTASLTLDPASRCALRDGREIRLTAREYALLHALMARPGAVFSRDQLEERIYSGSDTVKSNAIEFLIHNLRRKIGHDQIENRRGVGWRVVS